ncbi:MAG TPA: tripartite tricarboxylate transporter substrate binding protein [Candidimonas sp.]|nr:tripartite tricarboxylate transporter substrate binding protein [Candidimonas sp.]
MPRLNTLCVLIAASTLLMPAALVHAQQYPDRPIRMVVPFPPGGSTDVLARLFSKSLSEELKQTIIIENKPGAGTVVGADAVAKANADGYTLLFSGASTYSVNPILYKKLPYNPEKAFEPLGILAATPLVLIANPGQIKANTLKELETELKGKSDVAYASFGGGSTSNFVGEMFNAALGINAFHVPYKGSAPAMTDLIGGQVPLSVDTVVAAAPQLKAGKIKAIAVSGANRSQLLPQVPTATESGYPEVQFSTWFAIVAPAGLTSEVQGKLVSAIAQTMKSKTLQEQFVANGFEPEYGTPAEQTQRMADDSKRLKAIADKAKIAIN